MPKTFTSPFPQSQKTATAVASMAVPLTGANSMASDSAAPTVPLLTAGPEGAMVTRICAIPRGTVTATFLALYLRKSTDAPGVRTLLDSVTMAAYTANATVGFPTTFFTQYNEGTPLRLAPGDELHVGIGVAVAAGVAFRAEFLDF